MNLKDQLIEDMKSAMKARDAVKLGVVRYLRSEIKNFEIDNGEQNDEGVIKIISSQAKKMRDAILEFKEAGRDDLVVQEEEKIMIMDSYLPKQLTDAELEEIVSKVISQSEEKNMGKLIGESVKAVAGKADGSRISAMIRNKLQ
ncbi:MAG: GatB/YqeY domain-containing protein [Pseudomonadales bacterium]|nr:GatB/YqeY domain-containing protein [Pseudomonadales bacterium]